MASVIIGVDSQSCAGQDLGEARIAGAVLAHSVGDMKDASDVALRCPAVNKSLTAIVCRVDGG